MGRHGISDTQPIPVVKVETPIHIKLRRYAKWWVAITGAIGTAATTLTMTEGPLTWEDWINTSIAFLTALGVLGIRNRKKEE